MPRASTSLVSSTGTRWMPYTKLRMEKGHSPAVPLRLQIRSSSVLQGKRRTRPLALLISYRKQSPNDTLDLCQPRKKENLCSTCRPDRERYAM